MDGVDKHDQLVSYYRVFIKSRKLTLRMVFHALGNSWLEYKQETEIKNVAKKTNRTIIIVKNFFITIFYC